MSREEITKEVDKALEKAPAQRNSLFQMKYFIIGNQPTWNAKLWQCLLEMRRNKETIDALNNEKEEMRDQLELVRIELDEMASNPAPTIYDKRKKEVLLRQLERRKVNIERSMNNVEQKLEFAFQESKFFLETFKGIDKEFPVADFDNEEAQTEYWNAKFKEELDLRMLLQQPLDLELIKSTLSLPDEAQCKQQMLGTLAAIQKQMIEQRKAQESNRIQTNVPKNLNNGIRLTQ